MALIAASAVSTCLGGGSATFARLLAGDSGVTALRYVDPISVNVKHGYHQPVQARANDEEPMFQATRWLAECLTEVLAVAGPMLPPTPVPVLIGTGLRELRAVERHALDGRSVRPAQLHFAAAAGEVSPLLGPVITISNACSAAGHAVALAQDLVEHGDVKAAVAAGTDAMTASMLAMIGRVTDEPTEKIQPFDKDRIGALLGEGAAAVLVVPDSWNGPVAARLLGTGMSCDAHHGTAPSLEGIVRAMEDALARAGRRPTDVDIVVSHGTGTALNDVTEARAIQRVLVDKGAAPWVTAVKGALGHTSGASALMSLDVAIRCLADGLVPPIVGLREPLAEARALRLVRGSPARSAARIAQINSFGFGGVNAVTLIETLS